MGKKLISAGLALAALAAFMLSAGASAATITSPTGSTLATGSTLTGTSTSTTTLWNTNKNIKLLECAKGTLTGNLVGNVIEPRISITSATFSGTGGEKDGRPECTGELGSSSVDTNVGNGVPWCLSVTSTVTFAIRGNSCSLEGRSITFVVTSTVAGTCKYNRTASVTGTVNSDTSQSDAVFSVFPTVLNPTSEFKLEEGGFLCPSAGLLEMSFTLERDEQSSPLLAFVS